MSSKLEKAISLKVFETPLSVSVDWEYALKVCKNLDKTAKEENRLPISGKAAIMILAEYAAIVHKCAWPPSDVGVVVVVCPPSVWVCPNATNNHKLFVAPYSKENHGEGLEFTGKDDIFDFCSVSARLDGWAFAAKMTFSAKAGGHDGLKI